MSEYQYKRVQWDDLRVGDIVVTNGNFKELVAILDRDKFQGSKVLFFGTGDSKNHYCVKGFDGELAHYIRVLRPEEGGQLVSEMDLALSAGIIDSPQQILCHYKKGKQKLLADIKAGKQG